MLRRSKWCGERGSTMDDRAALVLLSGGQDSATARLGHSSVSIAPRDSGFDYGQRKSRRARLPPRVARRDRRALPALGGAGSAPTPYRSAGAEYDRESALTRDSAITAGAPMRCPHLRARPNVVFLTFAAAWLMGARSSHLSPGMCETDYSAIPTARRYAEGPCRSRSILGMDRRSSSIRR